MDVQYVSKNDLYFLFTNTDLIETTYSNYKKKLYKSHQPNLILSPMTKLIYNSVPQEDRNKLLEDIILDNNYIEQLDDNDPDYIEKLANNKLGLYMEDFVCYYMKCPICRSKTLRKYKINNMPVIDVICTNTQFHKNFNNIKFFQIKISVNSNSYFNKQYILVGSKKFGFNCHEIMGNDTLKNKETLIGYICINLTEIKDGEYKINNKKSFILIPNITKNYPEYYYKYINNSNRFNHDAITWNKNLVNEFKLENLLDVTIVNTNSIFFNSNMIVNPYSQVNKKLNFNQLAGFYKLKYMKYKTKYLNYKYEHI